MAALSSADHRTSPPVVEIPRAYNAAHDLIERNLAAGRGDKLRAYIDDTGRYAYAELAARVNRAGNALKALGLGMEDRLMLCHLDTIDWPTVFLGAIKAGIVPVAVNTVLTSTDYEFMLNDSRAKALVVSEALLPQFAPIIARCRHVEHVIVSGTNAQRTSAAARSPYDGRHRARAGADDTRRRVLLALFVGLHRRAEGHQSMCSRA